MVPVPETLVSVSWLPNVASRLLFLPATLKSLAPSSGEVPKVKVKGLPVPGFTKLRSDPSNLTLTIRLVASGVIV